MIVSDDASLLDMLAFLRAAGWMVGVHNDYRQDGKLHTFWLFTHRSGEYIKGEGLSDEEAVRMAFRSMRKAFRSMRKG